MMMRVLAVLSLFSSLAHAQTPAPTPSATPPAATAPDGRTKTSLGFRVDCLHDFNLDKGEAQDCVGVSGLRFKVVHQESEKVRGMLQVDPFGTPRIGRMNAPNLEGTPAQSESALGIVDDFAMTWLPRPNLEVAVEAYEGAAHIPEMSGLATAGLYDDAGWKQTAITVTYNLTVPTEMKVRFAAGNGEGETVKNLDPQQYFGFSADARIVHGLRFNLGVSLDGNDVGSEEYNYLAKRYLDDCGIDLAKTKPKLGHSTQRLAAGFALDGTMPGLEGFKLGLGWQRNVMSDLDKKRPSAPSEADIAKCRKIDPDTIFVEDSGEAVNTVQRTVYGLNLSYRIFTSYFVAFAYETRRIDTGSVELFEVCKGFTDGACSAPTGDKSNQLTQDAYAVGAGIDLEQDLTLTVEYAKESYDRTYTKVFFDNQDDKVSESRELFNARLAYNFP